IVQLEKLLHTLDVSSSIYDIPSLKRPEEVNCYYFCNDNGALFTEEGSLEFFQIGEKEYVFDYLECSRKWNKKIPKLATIKIKSPSHFTVLSEPESQKIITSFCNKLYSEEVITNSFLESYLLKES
ncbi:MAG: hypothetical protein UIM53_01880, partial [Acutalibacteraceae bacterium]|nr:hypothetical protein [Acutalibacteraceae bacterium]